MAARRGGTATPPEDFEENIVDIDVAEARVSRSRPDTGIVTFKCSVRNAAGQQLCDWVSPIIVQCRAAVAAEAAR